MRDAGGVVRSASVHLIDDNTHLTIQASTNDAGEYALEDVLPGAYTIRVEAPGYKTFTQSHIVVSTQAALTIDVQLAVGDVAETVTVQATPAVIDSTSVSRLIDRHDLDAWPSAGRNVFVAGTTTPTVLLTGDSHFVRQQDQSNSSLISMGGGPRRDNSYVFDGVPIVDILNRATFIPSYHAVEEVRVQVSAYDADIGRTSGGVFNTTSRSGSNQWRGTAMYQDRPSWAQGRLFFAEKNDIPTPDGYFHLYGGGVGGPIAHDRTFFWASTEGYRSDTAASTVLVLPTDAERRGDFSQAGITIYDPLTTRRDPADSSRFIRDPFPGNRIPPNRLNPVAVAMLQYLPLPTSGTSRPAAADVVDAADQLTGKITHRWNERITMTGLYAWYGSQEPDARFFGQPLFQNAADPGEGALVRRTHLVAINTMWTPNTHTFVELRYGFNQFLDDNRPAAFDPSSLGFAPQFLASVPQLKFPTIGVAGYGRFGSFLGDRFQGTNTYYSHNASAAVSMLLGHQTIKAGGEFRVTGVRFLNLGGMGGYNFSADFTAGPNPNAPANAGDAFASFLLGYPSSGGISISDPINVYLNYWSGFAQDEFRVTPKLTVTAGLRYEFEQGLQERNDRMVTGWAYNEPFPVHVNGLTLTGGVLFAGVNGAPTEQGDPRRTQFAPRASFAYAIDDRTAVRGGYGLFWAPPQGITADSFGSATPGFDASTNYVATSGNPLIPCAGCSLTNPFPSGIAQPQGNALGRLTGVGGTIWFADPSTRLAHLHRYSIDIERQLPHAIGVGAGYIGSHGVDLAGGMSGAPIDINQLDPTYAALGTALQDPVPNPFLGTPLAVGILAGPTVPRGQLLRPYPQFDTVYINRSNVARSWYNAINLHADRRLASHWSARVDYTWSRTRDSQFSESNFFSGGSSLIDNYDIGREYGLSALDTPHRLTVTTSVELPLDIMLSATGSYQSGYPISVFQALDNSNLFGSGQRPNIVAGVNAQLNDDPNNYDPSCSCIRWLNPAAWAQAAPFTFGNAPRTDDRARTPARRNWDLAVEKTQRFGSRRIAIRAELINVFNFADLRGPNNVFGDPSFGQIREAAGFPRMLQVSVRAGW